jgi:hypothetical protein
MDFGYLSLKGGLSRRNLQKKRVHINIWVVKMTNIANCRKIAVLPFFLYKVEIVINNNKDFSSQLNSQVNVTM